MNVMCCIRNTWSRVFSPSAKHIRRHSPDRGDALLGCIACGSRIAGAVRAQDVVSTAAAGNGFGTGHVTGF